MLVTTLIIVLVLDIACIAYSMVNAPAIDDDENLIVSEESSNT